MNVYACIDSDAVPYDLSKKYLTYYFLHSDTKKNGQQTKRINTKHTNREK